MIETITTNIIIKSWCWRQTRATPFLIMKHWSRQPGAGGGAGEYWGQWEQDHLAQVVDDQSFEVILQYHRQPSDHQEKHDNHNHQDIIFRTPSDHQEKHNIWHNHQEKQEERDSQRRCLLHNKLVNGRSRPQLAKPWRNNVDLGILQFCKWQEIYMGDLCGWLY